MLKPIQTKEEFEESLKLTKDQKILVERLGDMPRDYSASTYALTPYVIKVRGVWKQIWL